MRPPITITTDGAGGLTKAIAPMGPKSLRIRWWFHQMQNFPQKVPARGWPEVKALLGEMREVPPREKAEQRREAMVEKYPQEFPKLCRC